MVAGKRTILYIEDDPASRTLVERTLNHAGYQVLVAERGLEGIDLARRIKPDLILTDINLPDISGREITTMLRSDARFKFVPIVALTAQAYTEQREMTMAAGITGYLTKPLDIEALPAQVEYYLGGGRDQISADVLTAAQSRYVQEVVSHLEARIRDLEDSNEALRRLDNMKDTFIQLTAHELRTPLTLVYGYSRLLEDNPAIREIIKTDENTSVLFKGLVEAIHRMQSIINEILTISRIMTNQIDLSIGPTQLAIVVRKATEDYQTALKTRNLTLEFDPTDWPQRIRADAELLQLAISSILSNAIKYTPDGGSISINVQADDEYVHISVKDSGIGIAIQDQERVFERFHTTSDTQLHSTSKTAFRGGGLGLGLAICRGIVEAHNGRIWVESPGYDPDRCPGSEFIIQLPLVASVRKMSV